MARPFALAVALCSLLSCPAAAFEFSSSDIAPGAEIATAQIYPRCGGQNVSPALSVLSPGMPWQTTWLIEVHTVAGYPR